MSWVVDLNEGQAIYMAQKLCVIMEDAEFRSSFGVNNGYRKLYKKLISVKFELVNSPSQTERKVCLLLLENILKKMYLKGSDQYEDVVGKLRVNLRKYKENKSSSKKGSVKKKGAKKKSSAAEFTSIRVSRSAKKRLEWVKRTKLDDEGNMDDVVKYLLKPHLVKKHRK